MWWRTGRHDWWLPLLILLVVAIELALKLAVPQTPPPGELARSVHLLPFLESPTRYSFPSGHVARVAFLSAVFGWRWPAWAGAVAVMAVTRVYLGDHWPSDVVGGALLGVAVAFAGLRATRPRHT